MDEQTAIDLGRQALTVTMLIAAPVLIAGMVVGLVVGLLQALTQIQEQTVAFVPKIVAMLLVLSLSLPWLTAQMLEYSEDLINDIPETISASSKY
jgi:flagellar biosynthetic protein FliQ